MFSLSFTHWQYDYWHTKYAWRFSESIRAFILLNIHSIIIIFALSLTHWQYDYWHTKYAWLFSERIRAFILLNIHDFQVCTQPVGQFSNAIYSTTPHCPTTSVWTPMTVWTVLIPLCDIDRGSGGWHIKAQTSCKLILFWRDKLPAWIYELWFTEITGKKHM